MLKILVAEDDVSTNKLLCAILKINGYEAIPAFNGEAALDIIDHQHIDLLLCDVMMPKMDGFALTQAIRDGGSMMPILMLTAKALPEDKHTGFLVGTDDYMTKPFNILEVKARVKTILRRTTMAQKENSQRILTVRDMQINLNNRSVKIGGKEVNLTAKEFDLLELLAKNPNKVYSRENLLNLVWGYEYPGDVRTVDVHVRRLREKIEKNPSEPKYVHTKWGVGYYYYQN